MKKIFLTLVASFAFLSASLAQSYSTSFKTDEEKAGWQQYRTKYNGPYYKWEFGKYGFFIDDIYTTKPALLHRCNNVAGVPDTIIDWMVSPPLQFSSPSELYIHFFVGGLSRPGIGYQGCKVYFSGGSPDPMMGDYMEIADLTTNLPRYGGIWYDTNIHITHTAAKGYIAFVYYIEGVHSFEMSIDSVTTTAQLVGIFKHEIDIQNSITIFPNPTTGQLRITNYEIRDGDIEIFDVLGRRYHQAPSLLERAGGEVIIDISHLANGMYYLKIDNKVVKFVKE